MMRHVISILFAVFLFQNSISAFAQSKQPAPNSDRETQGAPEAKTPPRRVRTQPKASSDSGPKWEIEFHGGLSKSSESGGWSLPPDGVSYSLAGSGAQGYTSIRVSSWYYGDGAELVGSKSSLESIMTRKVVDTESRMIGFRASRALTNWFSAEFSFDRGSRLKISDGALKAIESARADFKKAWQRLDVPGNTPSSSVSAIHAYGGSQTFLTGSAILSWPKGRVRPYAVVGGGVLSTGGGTLDATLSGSYGGPTALETDTVRLTFSQGNSRAFAAVVGAGVKVYLNKHFGLRLDGRGYFYKNPVTTLLDVSHTNTPNAAWVVKATGGSTVPYLQLLTGPGISSYSTLSGPAISGMKTYFVSGYQRLVPVSIGFFWRF